MDFNLRVRTILENLGLYNVDYYNLVLSKLRDTHQSDKVLEKQIMDVLYDKIVEMFSDDDYDIGFDEIRKMFDNRDKAQREQSDVVDAYEVFASNSVYKEDEKREFKPLSKGTKTYIKHSVLFVIISLIIASLDPMATELGIESSASFMQLFLESLIGNNLIYGGIEVFKLFNGSLSTNDRNEEEDKRRK